MHRKNVTVINKYVNSSPTTQKSHDQLASLFLLEIQVVRFFKKIQVKSQWILLIISGVVISFG